MQNWYAYFIETFFVKQQKFLASSMLRLDAAGTSPSKVLSQHACAPLLVQKLDPIEI